MSNQTVITRPVRGSFDVTEACLIKLLFHAHSFLGKSCAVRVKFRSGRAIEGTDLESILDDSFVRAELIEEIVLSGRTPGEYFHLIMDEAQNFPIIVTIGGERDEALKLEREFMNEFSAIEQWYSTINLSRIPGVQKQHLLPFISFSGLVIFIGFSFVPSHFWTDRFPLALILCLGFGVLPVIGSYLVPNITFNIGASRIKKRNRDYVRSLVFGTIIIGIIVGVFGNIAYSWITPAKS